MSTPQSPCKYRTRITNANKASVSDFSVSRMDRRVKLIEHTANVRTLLWCGQHASSTARLISYSASHSICPAIPGQWNLLSPTTSWPWICLANSTGIPRRVNGKTIKGMEHCQQKQQLHRTKGEVISQWGSFCRRTCCRNWLDSNHAGSMCFHLLQCNRESGSKAARQLKFSLFRDLHTQHESHNCHFC